MQEADDVVVYNLDDAGQGVTYNGDVKICCCRVRKALGPSS